MPLPRRRSSILSQAAVERPSNAGRVIVSSTAAPRGGLAGTAPSGVACSLGTRVSRRVLGINSVFLNDTHTITSTLPQHVYRGHQLGPESLNCCLLEYRDKVHALEQLNQQLEEQIRNWLERKASTAEAWSSLRHEWEDIYKQVSETILDNARLTLQMENVQASAEDFKERFENEQPFCKMMEEEMNSLYKVIDDATLTKIDLENQIESMKSELLELDKRHEEDVRQLYDQLAGREADEPDEPIETNLDQILSYIRAQWEKVIEKTKVEMGTYTESKEENVNSMRSQEELQMEYLKKECYEASTTIQSFQAEIESIRALKRGLENSLNDSKHWHNIELQNLGSVIGKLEAELRDVSGDIEQQKLNYEILLNNKKRLEMEIGMYHEILDGEESRYHPLMCSTDTAPADTVTLQTQSEQQSTSQTDDANVITESTGLNEKKETE